MALKPKPIIGAHVSSAGGLPRAVENAIRIGADAIQVFGSSPRQWAARVPEVGEAAAFRAVVRKAGLRGVFIHAPYLINLGSPSTILARKSVDLLAVQLRIGEAIGADGVIVHAGSGEEGLFRERSLVRAAKNIVAVFKRASGKTMLLLENSATSTKIGRDFTEIASLCRMVGSPRLGACLDTAHTFESGVAKDYSPADVRSLGAMIERTIGWRRLRAIHANDSKTIQGSEHDRHENIGKGYIGADGFKNLLAHQKFRAVPFLLEVPGFAGEGPDKKNVDILKKLAD